MGRERDHVHPRLRGGLNGLDGAGLTTAAPVALTPAAVTTSARLSR